MSGDHVTNPSLLIRLRDPRNEAAWATFQEVYEPLIFRFCLAQGLQEADARDVTQDVLRSVSQAIGGFDYDPARGTFRSWLYQVTRSKLINHFKQRGRSVQGSGRTDVHKQISEQPFADDEDQWDHEAERRLFEWACNQVRPLVATATWQAFWGTAVENNPAATVAEELGISIGATYIARSRVTARLRDQIAIVTE